MTDIPQGSPWARQLEAQAAAERQPSLRKGLFSRDDQSPRHDRGILPNCLGRETGRER